MYLGKKGSGSIDAEQRIPKDSGRRGPKASATASVARIGRPTSVGNGFNRSAVEKWNATASRAVSRSIDSEAMCNLF